MIAKSIASLALYFLLLVSPVYAQRIGIGAATHHLVNGIMVDYAKPINKKWNHRLGFLFIINHQPYNKNLQNNIYYQNGLPKHIYERFSISYKIGRDIITYRKFSLSMQLNSLLSYHSLLTKTRAPLVGTGQIIYSEVYRKAAPSLQLSLTPCIKYQINHTWAIELTAGYGIIGMLHNFRGVDLISGQSWGLLTPNSNRQRGDYEIVGTEQIPHVYLGLQYSLPKKK